ncbi:hypothetical protein NBO_58g0019 [Nosema bombycis CQ1]|uniref:Uncharacterized protein n=1 Tax=Nosema bombycis (strain CQ1 / CVCC 102059) TaxID=578461 RepID=R0MI46_NOSB1|nr:hypothetical protein NBO_58g0019 [Nosema bombycis CQ1]|eukprot:EOB13815.1 hypothetical protein NBO_58g0019 [Nosema bombycis CQ1]
MNFDYQKKTVICKFNSFIVKGTNSLEVCVLNVKKSKEHAMLHDEPRTISRLVEIFNEPEQILKSENYKENLKTYVSLVSKGKVLFKERKDSENKTVVGLLRHKEKYWSDLLQKDIHSFVQLTKLLDFDAYRKFRLRSKQFEMIKIKKEITNKERLMEIIKDNPKISTPIMIHVDFCLFNSQPDPLKIFDEEYKRMLNFILYDQKYPIDRIKINSLVYKEIEIFNKFLNGEEYEIKRKEYKTVNERGIRDFIQDGREW